MSPETPVQRQLDAYNARDLQAFLANYTEDVRVFRPPAPEPIMSGKPALAAHHANNRFNLPALHAKLVNRIVIGNRVIDHEHVTGIDAGTIEVAAVYEVTDGLISSVWFF